MNYKFNFFKIIDTDSHSFNSWSLKLWQQKIFSKYTFSIPGVQMQVRLGENSRVVSRGVRKSGEIKVIQGLPSIRFEVKRECKYNQSQTCKILPWQHARARNHLEPMFLFKKLWQMCVPGFNALQSRPSSQRSNFERLLGRLAPVQIWFQYSIASRTPLLVAGQTPSWVVTLLYVLAP